MTQDRTAATAAFAVALLGLAALATGMALVAMLGGTTGQDLGQGAAAEDFGRAVPLLALAEMLKLAIAGAEIVVALAIARVEPPGAARTALFAAGIAGALFVTASGLGGFYAIAAADPSATSWISALGFAGIGSTGLWALLLLGLHWHRFSRWHAFVGLLFSGASLAALAVPPAALLSGVVGLAWWLGLGARLRGA